jgi:hypothetical protein
MSIEEIRAFLLFCFVINYGILLLWFLCFFLTHDWLYHWHAKWFRLSREQFNVLHYGGMAIFKIGILLFNLTPFIALWIVS